MGDNKPTSLMVDNVKYVREGTTAPVEIPAGGHPYPIGKAVFIRTVTMYYLGQLEAVYEGELLLSSVSWVASTGQFTAFLATGAISEVEMYPANTQVVVPRGGIMDLSEWSHALPTSRK